MSFFFVVLATKVKRITVSTPAASLAEDITGQGVPQVHEIPADAFDLLFFVINHSGLC